MADFDELCEALADHRAAAAEDAAAGGADDEVPEDFLDPITTALMRDPVVLPDSQVRLPPADGGPPCHLDLGLGLRAFVRLACLQRPPSCA